MRLFLELLIDLVIGPRGVRDIESATFIEVRRDGPVHQTGPRYEFDLKALGHGKGLTCKPEFGSVDTDTQGSPPSAYQEERRSIHTESSFHPKPGFQSTSSPQSWRLKCGP